MLFLHMIDLVQNVSVSHANATCINERGLVVSKNLRSVLPLAAIVVLSVSLKRHRKKDALMSSKEDARDNVIRYDDEGGGEEDTQAFDIGTLRHPEVIEDTHVQRYDHRDEEDSEDVNAYLQRRLQENHRAGTEPPFDSLATFAYEGEGSMAESLSSIESRHHDSNINDDLRAIGDLGPCFHTLTLILAGQKEGEDELCLPHAEGSEPRRDD